MKQRTSIQDLRNERINNSTFNIHTANDEGAIRGKKMKLQEGED